MTTALIKHTAGVLLILASSLATAAGNSNGHHLLKTKRQYQTLTPAPVRPVLVQPATGQKAIPAPTTNWPPSGAMILHKDSLLSQDIESWATAQGLRLLWNSKKDYLIYSAIVLNGQDRDAVLNRLGQLFQSENYGLVIKLYSGNNVLIIDGQ